MPSEKTVFKGRTGQSIDVPSQGTPPEWLPAPRLFENFVAKVDRHSLL